MAKFLFTAVAASGHINPTLPLVRELRRRGHEVGYATSPNMAETVGPAATRFFPVGPDLGPDSGDRPEWAKYSELRGRRRMSFVVGEILYPLAETTARELLDVVASFRPDALVFDFMTFASNLVGGVTKLPWATTTMAPGLLQSKGAYPYGLALPYSDGFRRLSSPLFWTLARAAMSREFDGQFNAIRARFGLPPVRNTFFTAGISPYLVLALLPREIEYPRDAWPPVAHFIGSPRLGGPASARAPAWLEALPRGRPLVYATLGTTDNQHHPAYLAKFMEAVRGLDADVVVTFGNPSLVQAAPDNVRLERYVPNALIMPKARVVMHHGGPTSACDALAHGKPVVVTPFVDDQFEVAQRVRRLGAGAAVNPYKVTVLKLRAAIDGVLASTAMRERAAELGRAMGRYDAAAAGADLLERLARTGAPVPNDDPGSLPPSS